MSGLVPTLVGTGLTQVFTTRSPCVIPSYGRMLPVVCARPAGDRGEIGGEITRKVWIGELNWLTRDLTHSTRFPTIVYLYNN